MKRKIGLTHCAGLLVALVILGTTARFAIARKALHHPIDSPASAATPPSSQPFEGDGTEDLIRLNMRGKRAPDFSLRDTNGNKVSLASLKGHSVVVNFWATYCDPCQSEMPSLEALENQYRERGLVMIGINQDDGISPGKIAAAAKRLGVTYPILLPDTTVSRTYGGVEYLPETFYIDRNGTICTQTAGARTKSQIEHDIRNVLASGTYFNPGHVKLGDSIATHLE